MPKFRDPYKFVIDGEKNSQETFVEIGGYRTVKQMIEEFVVSGKRLEEARADQYDYDDDVDVDDAEFDPTREKGFDLADASNIVSELAEAALSSQGSKSEKQANEKNESEPAVSDEKPEEEKADSENSKPKER